MKYPLSIAEAIDDLIEARMLIPLQTTKSGREEWERRAVSCKAELVEALAEVDDDT